MFRVLDHRKGFHKCQVRLEYSGESFVLLGTCNAPRWDKRNCYTKAVSMWHWVREKSYLRLNFHHTSRFSPHLSCPSSFEQTKVKFHPRRMSRISLLQKCSKKSHLHYEEVWSKAWERDGASNRVCGSGWRRRLVRRLHPTDECPWDEIITYPWCLHRRFYLTWQPSNVT